VHSDGGKGVNVNTESTWAKRHDLLLLMLPLLVNAQRPGFSERHAEVGCGTACNHHLRETVVRCGCISTILHMYAYMHQVMQYACITQTHIW
jgi:hypothetical protein